MIDVDSVRQRLDIALSLYKRNQMKRAIKNGTMTADPTTVDPLAAFSEEQLATFMRELYSGIMGGRKLHYQIKLALNRGIDLIQEPMLGSMIHTLQLANIQSIKKKARIYMQESATLIGVVDETGLLEENEIFVQIRRDSFSCKMRMGANGTH